MNQQREDELAEISKQLADALVIYKADRARLLELMKIQKTLMATPPHVENPHEDDDLVNA